MRWRSLFAPGEMDCRIESLANDASEFDRLREVTREWSPFELGLFARIHRGGVLLALRGERVFIDPSRAEHRSTSQD